MINIIASAVVRAGIGKAKGLFKSDGYPGKVSALGRRPCSRERRWEKPFREKCGSRIWVKGISRAGLLDDVVKSVHFVMPRAPMPMVVAGEIKNSRSFHVQRNVLIFGQLIEKMAGVSS